MQETSHIEQVRTLQDSQLCKKIKALRNKHDISQNDAALLVRVSQRSWARYESGDRTPPDGLLELFCLKLGEKYPDTLV